MSVKEWLRRARVIDKEINQLLIAKQEAFERAIGTGIDPSREQVQGGGGNGSENKFLKVAEYELLIDEKIDKLLEVKQEIITAVEAVKNDTYRTLLLAYYVNCKTWEQVAEDMGYDVRHIRRLHNVALEKVVII